MKRKKKGFTLVELIAVVVVLSLVVALSSAIFISVRKNILKKDYDNLVTYLEAKAQEYANKTNITTISVEDLIKEGVIKPDDQSDIYNPQNNESMNCYIIKSTFEDGQYVSKLSEDLGKSDGKCNTYEKTSAFQMCVLDSNGNCDALSSDAWFKDDVTLAIKYSNGKVVENASFNWTSTSGLSSTESKILTNTEDALVNMSTYRCEVTIDQEDGKKLQGEVSNVVGIDKQFPVIEEAKYDTNWAPSKEVVISATDMTGSGIKGYSFVGENEDCGKYQSDNKKTYTSTGTYKYCVSDNVGNVTTETFTIEKIDSATPKNPEISASDGISSGKWHTGNPFTLTFSKGMGVESKSEVKFYYGTNANNLNNIGNSLGNISTNYSRQTIYVKACNEAGKCSGISSYKVYYDNTPPHYVSGGSIGAGSISKPRYEDNTGGSGNVTVYVCATTGGTPSKNSSCFSSVSTSFSYSCGTTYTLYSYAKDGAGNTSNVMSHNTYYEACYVPDPDPDPTPSRPSGGSSHRPSGGSSGGGSYCDNTCQMKQNSEKWWEYENNNSMSEEEKKAKQEELHQKNQDLAKGNKDCKGSCDYTKNNGKWNDSNGKPLYDTSNGKKP